VPVDIRQTKDLDEFQEAFLAIGQYFGAEPNEERISRFSESLPIERMHAAWENGQIVGGAGAFPFELSVPGGSVRCAGVTVVGVYPTHRRRGVLRAMMRTQLDDVRKRGEPIAALWASEETIYGRFGYGLASLAGEIRLPREYGAFAHPFAPRGNVRFAKPEEAVEVLPAIWERAYEQTPGMFRRDRAWWQNRVVFDPPDRRGGAGPKRFAVLELDGEPAAYAIYRHEPKWEEGVSQAKLHVVEAIAATSEAERELWGYLLGVDWVATIEAHLLPIDHPLWFLLATPRRMRMRVGDGLWIRIVDVGEALSRRAYAQDDVEVVFEVVDDFADWNNGRWKVAGGNCQRTDDDADLRLDVQALGSVFLGGFTFAELRRGMRIEELRDGAISRADAVFRTDRAPWCPEIF
jgi:predicted acetyltransferase